MNVSLVMRWIPQFAWALLMSLWLSSVAAGEAPAVPRTCYPQGVPAPAVSQTVVTLVDLTTPVGEAYDGLVTHLINRPVAGRHVVLSFSALGGQGEQLRKVFDAVLPAAPPPELQRALPMRLNKAIHTCVRQEAARFPSALQQTMLRVRAQAAGQEFQHSEVVHALHEALSAFAGSPGQVHFYVYSDGLQNGSGSQALSFYARGKPRAIDAKKELARLPETVKTMPASAAHVQLTWVGLGVLPSASGHVSPQAVDSWKTFWHELLASHWHINEPTIVQSLINSQ